MNRPTDEHIPGDITEIADRLWAERTEATPLELDELKVRVKARARRAGRQGMWWRSRLAFVLALVLGILASGSGAALGVSALSEQGNISQAQYGVAPGGELGQEQTGGEGGEDAGEEAGERAVQGPRQVGVSGGGRLPFTGYLAIPLIVMGLGLMLTGVLLRRAGRHSATGER